VSEIENYVFEIGMYDKFIVILIQNRQAHAHVIDTNLLALCYSDMLWPSKGHIQGVQLMHFHSKINEICTRCKSQFIEQRVLYYMAHA